MNDTKPTPQNLPVGEPALEPVQQEFARLFALADIHMKPGDSHCRCPFPDDCGTSLRVDRVRSAYHCYGGGREHGDTPPSWPPATDTSTLHNRGT